MSDPENFMARWSRLKRVATEEKKAEPGAVPKPDDATVDAEQPTKGTPAQVGSGPSEPAFDLASLPPIDSISAGSDIRAFLQSGVPAELTKAALRRAWTADPAIRHFIGIAENQWDFTDPTAMPGFGPLEATDDVRQLVGQAMGELGRMPAPDVGPASPEVPDTASASSSVHAPSQDHMPPQVAGMPERNETAADARESVEEHNKTVPVALQHADPRAHDSVAPNRRTRNPTWPLPANAV